jgi:hypothetical protein
MMMMIQRSIDLIHLVDRWIDVASHLLRTAAGPHQPIGNNMNDRSLEPGASVSA